MESNSPNKLRVKSKSFRINFILTFLCKHGDTMPSASPCNGRDSSHRGRSKQRFDPRRQKLWPPFHFAYRIVVLIHLTQVTEAAHQNARINASLPATRPAGA